MDQLQDVVRQFSYCMTMAAGCLAYGIGGAFLIWKGTQWLAK